ncbi:hypothetical protein [Actinomadura sp. NEAU-AAG7]|uniref:hypothetical protein n=1 Tax=Actinomadura sp. NEAU-AAG7 TaxID=2839640 RepID=UPI001BE47B96|nr:hypothetical protein [Actinomadura sp. NEAU-AAG7]MBT2208112.1 hypothetical protein [Actinomadura sp. NEAU-AAG7]
MTIAPERTAEAVKDPRDLVSPEVFALLVEDIMRYDHVTRAYAERLMGQALVFLKAHAELIKAAATDPEAWVRIVPSVPVDEGWHAFLKRTKPYHEFGMTHAGAYLHHVPVVDADILSGAALERTVPILRATGYHVDMEFWEAGVGAGCCPPECSTIAD